MKAKRILDAIYTVIGVSFLVYIFGMGLYQCSQAHAEDLPKIYDDPKIYNDVSLPVLLANTEKYDGKRVALLMNVKSMPQPQQTRLAEGIIWVTVFGDGCEITLKHIPTNPKGNREVYSYECESEIQGLDLYTYKAAKPPNRVFVLGVFHAYANFGGIPFEHWIDTTNAGVWPE